MGKIIGITGGIASGKSTVTDYLRKKGYAVIDADAVVHELQAPGGRLYQVLVEHFGDGILLDNGELNRVALAQRIFSDEQEKSWSNQVQGEIIRTELAKKRDAVAEQYPLFFMDIPLLFEQGYEAWFDAIWLIDVAAKTQKERLMKRDNCSEDEAQKRISSQWPSEVKKASASLIIDNNQTINQTLHQVQSALEELLD